MSRCFHRLRYLSRTPRAPSSTRCGTTVSLLTAAGSVWGTWSRSVLEERTTSQKSAETTLTKESTAELPNPKVLGSLLRGNGSDLFNSVDSETGFAGGAESDQSNSLFGTITAVIAEVYPNGLMRIRGEKWLNLNRGEEYLRVSGLLRPQDIGDDNSVSSTRLADARIAYSGTGTFADSNQAGWLSRFFLNPKYPF